MIKALQFDIEICLEQLVEVLLVSLINLGLISIYLGVALGRSKK
jgi:hypothetical protein